MIRFAFILALILLFAIQGYAKDVATVIGAGNVSCGKWSEVRNKPSQHYQLKEWILGFISGSNWYTEGSEAIPHDQPAVVGCLKVAA